MATGRSRWSMCHNEPSMATTQLDSFADLPEVIFFQGSPNTLFLDPSRPETFPSKRQRKVCVLRFCDFVFRIHRYLTATRNETHLITEPLPTGTLNIHSAVPGCTGVSTTFSFFSSSCGSPSPSSATWCAEVRHPTERWPCLGGSMVSGLRVFDPRETKW